ncbi:uncharacterized protein LOC132947808 [Metopolophium dirhodum]|uniref:uncharacterized protein LOC132947808 n=1 Tax=Metopolophium dirhodum TaxID=44670 RepID=UPI00298FC1CF|nr:uncharacterized protein LOC132947808 [Metopolophium dirhodum]
MSDIEYISTQRKGECLIFNNYYFRIDKKIKNKKYWKCIENCGTRVIIISDEFTVHSDKLCNHNHSPRPVKIEEKRFKAKLRLRAKENPLEPIPKIYKEVRTSFLRQKGDCVTQNEREEAVATYQSVKSSIHRNKRKEVPPQPENRKDLHIPGLWRQTLDGRNFILCDDDARDTDLMNERIGLFVVSIDRA